MRTGNSLKNIFISIISAFIIAILGFISRKVFLDSLGVEYLGINGLLTNVLSMLALVESGIGVSIVYHLYKPLADNDKPRIIAFIQLYKKAYAVLATIILVLSIIMYPFLGKLIKDSESISYITIAYFIFVAKNMISYLNAHKVALINADQKEYILTSINFGFQVFTTIAKIIILISTENYILYLLIELAIYIIQTVFNSRIVEKRYSYIKTKDRYVINEKEKDSLIKNIKALFLHNIGSFCVFGTDNILISMFIGITTVGLYSNYTMIIGQLGSFLTPILSGIGASVGNLIAIESNDKSHSVFQVAYLINFWVYSIGVILLYNLLEPFIDWWLGKGYLLDTLTFIMILINFYITGLRVSIMTFKAKGGIFVQDKYMPLIEAAINLGASLVLVKYIGLAGIFLGTTISTLSTVFWNVPRLVYKHIFNMSVWSYFKKYIFYAILTLITCFITTNICNVLVISSGFMSLVAKGIICLIVPNIIYFFVFYKKEEFQYIKSILGFVSSGLKEKLTSVR
ncbi:hypothetical protein QEZ44_21410 [Bacillus cereus]|uniref:lipopolysaccharide biosynthesis protein n=1 Tax=Bacillus cereus TaxID=1396 RepID=UPI002452D84B|nr:hypothetical protein [Bacillus cereus]MDH4423927.1 hypothetical protein [Bacillus cereus]